MFHYTIDVRLLRLLCLIVNVLIAVPRLCLLGLKVLAAILILLCRGVKIFGNWQLLDTLYLGGDVSKFTIIGKVINLT